MYEPQIKEYEQVELFKAEDTAQLDILFAERKADLVSESLGMK